MEKYICVSGPKLQRCNPIFEGDYGKWAWVWATDMSLSKPLEKAMAPHSSTLAWKIPWTEEPGGLCSPWGRWVGHDWATSLSLFTFMLGEGNGNPLQCSCSENPKSGGAWWAAVYGVTQNRTRLKQLSNSSSSSICYFGGRVIIIVRIIVIFYIPVQFL